MTYLELDDYDWIDIEGKIKLNSKEGKKLNNLLILGYNIYKCFQTSSNTINIDISKNAVSKIKTDIQDLSETIISDRDEIMNEISKMIDIQTQKISKSMDVTSTKIQQNIDLITQETSKKITKKGCSQAIGVSNEKYIEAVITKYFPLYSVENTSKVAHSGDIILTMDSYSIMIECKAYKNTVPTSEINKFHRDMIKKDIKYGIFISLTSKISNKPIFSYERLDIGTIIYCSLVEERDIIYAILLMKHILDFDKNNSMDYDIDSQFEMISDTLDSIFIERDTFLRKHQIELDNYVANNEKVIKTYIKSYNKLKKAFIKSHDVNIKDKIQSILKQEKD